MELKTYTLVDADAVAKYTTGFWPRHIQSLHEYGITIHGLWTDANAHSNRVMALVEYPPDEDAGEAANAYRASKNFVDDHADFDVHLITDEQTIRLEAVAVRHTSVRQAATSRETTRDPRGNEGDDPA